MNAAAEYAAEQAVERGAEHAVLEVEGLLFRRAVSANETFQVEAPYLAVERGARLAIVGPSGCGKSTLLDLLGLVRPPSEIGRLRICPKGKNTIDATAALIKGDLDAFAEVRWSHFGYVLQHGGLLPFLSARDNILLAADGKDVLDLTEIAQRLGIEALLDRKPKHLSVGERQRVSIARAIYNRPALLLADEPTSALDPPRAQEVLRLLTEIAEAFGAAVVLSSHDWSMIERSGFETLRPAITSSQGVTKATFARDGQHAA